MVLPTIYCGNKNYFELNQQAHQLDPISSSFSKILIIVRVFRQQYSKLASLVALTYSLSAIFVYTKF